MGVIEIKFENCLKLLNYLLACSGQFSKWPLKYFKWYIKSATAFHKFVHVCFQHVSRDTEHVDLALTTIGK